MPTLIKFLRSSVAQLRPEPAVLADGLPMLNTHESEPGLFFKARDGSLIKIGTASVGSQAPNSAPAGSTGNLKGEIWLDNGQNTPILKIYDGTQWVPFIATPIFDENVTIGGDLTVLGDTTLNCLKDGNDSCGLDGQVLSKDGGELRWQYIRTDNVIYVAKNGNDANDGLSPLTAKLTIKAALDIATPGTSVEIAPGDYYEDNPIVVPQNVAVEGYDLRTTTVWLLNDADMFHVNNGCYINQLSFRRVGSAFGRGIAAFPPGGAGTITKSPYVQNCTNFVQGSTGLKIDGNLAGGLKSMVLDAFTQFNPGGIGAHVFNGGYTQLVSMFTICSDKAVLVESGGLATASSSVSDFGNYGLYADGVGPLQYSAYIAGGGQEGFQFNIDGIVSGIRPYSGQVCTIGGLFYDIRGVNITNGGSGYVTAPDVTFSIGTGPNAIVAQGIAIVENGSVVAVEMVSTGLNYLFTDVVTVTFSGGGGSNAAGTAIKEPIYYTVEASTPLVGGSTTLTIAETLPYSPADNAEVNFYQVSRIVSNAHGFEWIGTGTDISTCLPQLGGVPVPENEVVQINGGRVSVTSTDQLGNFKVGEDLIINQNTGTIAGTAFEKSILATVIPYILAL